MRVVQALASVVKEHLDANVSCTSQLPLRCPQCTNPVCGKTKAWFKSHQTVLDHGFRQKVSIAQ